MIACPKGVKPNRMKPKDWEQPNFILFLKRLFPGCEIHHLIHNKRADRRRKDDRLVFPLLPIQHKTFHDTVGAEGVFFASIGVTAPYDVADQVWLLWEDENPSENEIIRLYSDRSAL